MRRYKSNDKVFRMPPGAFMQNTYPAFDSSSTQTFPVTKNFSLATKKPKSMLNSWSTGGVRKELQYTPRIFCITEELVLLKKDQFL